MGVYKCECCNFSTIYKHVLRNHLDSTRHKKLSDNNNVYDKLWICTYCQQKYTTHSGLWRHSKHCKPPIRENAILDDHHISVLEKINELQNQLVPFIQNTLQTHQIASLSTELDRNLTQEVSIATAIELENKTKRVELLEKTYLKKQKRHYFHDNNVIYIVTTEDNKLRHNYIIGKAKNLTFRLSTYNKTAEHEVVYYKKCPDEHTMNIIESMVMKKLEKYRECANRDRFILPEDADISLFTDVIDASVVFFE